MRDGAWAVVAVLTALLGIAGMGFLGHEFDRDRCNELEQRLSVQLDYSFRYGCVVPGSRPLP